MSRLDEIEQRCQKATPGPWGDTNSDQTHRIPVRRSIGMGPQWIAMVGMRHGLEPGRRPTPESEEQGRANLAFITNAREDIPWLIARIRELEDAQVDAIRYAMAAHPAEK